MRKPTIIRIAPPLAALVAVRPAAAAGPLAPAAREGSDLVDRVRGFVDGLGLPRGTVALYGAAAFFVIVGLSMVKKNRSTALLLLVMAGLLAYVGYSFVK